MVISPAIVRPYDLGVITVRTALNVNPETAQITAISDSIPQTLEVPNAGHVDGFPLRLKDIRVILDRPHWVLNPTSCDPMSVDALATGQNGATANLSNRFQVTNCAALDFAPSLSLSLKGGAKRGSHPAFASVLTMPRGDANISRVSVTLPSSEFLDQGHLNNICTRVQFKARECPAASIYGYARAKTPLFGAPLEGPVYLRSNPAHLLPDLVAALKGPESQPVEVDLDGRIDSVNDGIRNTFEVVPDAPVTEFTLEMQGGRKGLLVNSESLCGKPHRAIANFSAQNGRRYTVRPKVIAAGCRKAHRKRHQPQQGKLDPVKLHAQSLQSRSQGRGEE